LRAIHSSFSASGPSGIACRTRFAISFLSMSRSRVDQHVATLTDIFDRAKNAIKTPFPFATDINELARPLAIDGSLANAEVEGS